MTECTTTINRLLFSSFNWCNTFFEPTWKSMYYTKKFERIVLSNRLTVTYINVSIRNIKLIKGELPPSSLETVMQ